MKRPKMGDIFEIPLSDGRRAFGQYVFFDDKNGPLIQIFGFMKRPGEDLDLQQLVSGPQLFPPVITGLFAAIRSGLWRVVGHLPVRDFHYPGFVSALYNERTEKYSTWYLWDGHTFHALGSDLPQQYQQLERLVVWHPLSLVRRIETGDNPYAYPRHGA